MLTPSRIFIAAAPSLLLFAGACATTPAASYTEEERASCERMEEGMGLDTPHDHAAMKGTGMNPMNSTHERCMQIMGKTQ